LKNSEVAELAKDWFALPPNNAIDNPRAGDLDSNIAGGGRVNEFFNTIRRFQTFSPFALELPKRVAPVRL
jgi:hypothetical protein